MFTQLQWLDCGSGGYGRSSGLVDRMDGNSEAVRDVNE